MRQWGTEGRSDGRGDLRPPKRRRGVPWIFDSRRVVGVDAPDHVLVKELRGVRVANVRSVQSDRSADRVAGNLNKRSNIAVELTGDETADLLRNEIVVGVQSGSWRRILQRLRMSKSRHVHRRERRPLPIAAAERIAADFEPAAEGSQFGKDGVAD